MLKLRAFLTVLVILLVSLTGVQADSTDRADLCGDLPAADCQVLIDNESVMNSLNSFAFVMSMNLDVSGEEPMRLELQGGGAFALGDEALQAANEMSQSVADVDMSALIELLLTSLEGEIWLDLQTASTEGPTDLELSLRLKDGVIFVGAEVLEALTGESASGMEAFGIDLNDALGEMLEESGAMPATDMSDMKEAEAAATTIERLPDSEVNGVAVAVFEMDIDLNALLSLVSAEELAAATNDLDDADSAEGLIEAINVSEFAVRQYIGLDDKYTYRMKMSLDMSMAFEDEGEAIDWAMVMGMNIDLSDFGEPVVVEIPEDAFVFPLAMMMAMGSQ